MRGVVILSKDPEFFAKLRHHVRMIHDSVIDNESSIRILSNEPRQSSLLTGKTNIKMWLGKPSDIPKSESYIQIYNNQSDRHVLNLSEIPKTCYDDGYRYGFVADCRDKEMFCKIIGSISTDLDMLIYDDGGNLFHQDELTPDKLTM